MCKRSIEVIPGLLRMINRYEVELGKEKEFDCSDGDVKACKKKENWRQIEVETKKVKLMLMIIIVGVLYLIVVK